MSRGISTGNIPAGADLVAQHPDGWDLYVYRVATAKNGTLWVNSKLVRPGRHRGRNNLWLGYCIDRRDFNQGRDYQVLFAISEQYEPALDLWVENELISWASKKRLHSTKDPTTLEDIL